MSGKSVNWTKEQQQVIESRGTNLLVSAAAGSGKTAVLVERIIRMVTEGEHPLDIDKLLVMTFTNAAAAEMRERIGAAIEERLSENPGNEHLQIQEALVHHAQITTIDSFCLNVIRNHFNLLDLDPAFQIGDEGELTLLYGDVMKELLEDYYENGGERFERFVETYASGKGDDGIEDFIGQVYRFSQSNPYPEQWIQSCRKELQEDGRGAGERGTGDVSESTGAGRKADPEAGSEDLSQKAAQLPWMQFLLNDVKKQAAELTFQMTDALETCREDAFLCAYAPMFEQDVRFLQKLSGADSYEELCANLVNVSWTRLATVRSKEVDPERKAYVTGCRDRMKKAVGKMQELYCFAAPDEMAEDLEGTKECIEVLLELAEEFTKRYAQKKRERNLVDFNDLEHEALKVLIRLENGKTVYTEAADELSAQFEEVLVDEYQDSNLVQEALLHAVSRERFGRYNVFMVGDVKQSIYKFRLARPELFLEKYHSYEPYDAASGPCRMIELHQNFRSRAEVLNGINDVFYHIMTENLGNIRYTEETALHPGAKFAPVEEPCAGDETGTQAEKSGTQAAGIDQQAAESGKQAENSGMQKKRRGNCRAAELPELLLVDTGAAALSELDDEAADYTAKELEAKLIVSKIREMTDPENGLLVWDKKLHGTGGYRTAQYRDMVILLRSTAGWTETLLSILMNEGIPAYAESRMGYFNTIEVETVLSLLAVIDNPIQDIPLAAVLKSPVVGMSDRELAELMSDYRAHADKGQDRGIYGAMRMCLDRAGEKAAEMGNDVSGEIQEQTAGKTPASRQEEPPAYIRKLCEFDVLLRDFRLQSAYIPIHELIYRVYERTGYYHYVAAMPAGETRKANLDMLVEKAAAYERTSYKGLFNFIRYIENLKKYNTDFGEATTVGEEDNTVRIMSIHKSKGLEFPIVFLAGMGKKFNRQDAYGKLLIDPELGIGTDYFDLKNRLKTTTLKKNVLRRKMELDNLGEELRVLYVAMTRAKEKLVMTGTDRSLAKSLEKYAHVPVTDGQIPYTVLAAAGSYLDWLIMSIGAGKVRISMTEIPVSEMVGEELVRQVMTRQSREKLLGFDTERVVDAEFAAQLDRYLNAVYPHEADVRLHTKMSVSELKKQGQLTDEAESVCEAGPFGLDWDRIEDAGSQEAGLQGAGSKQASPQEADSQEKNMESDRGIGEDAWNSRSVEKTGGSGENVYGHGADLPRISQGSAAAALRGTALHRALYLLPFEQMESLQDVEVYLQKLTAAKQFPQSYCDLIDCRMIWQFLSSPLGKRMRLASAEERIRKEQQFVIGIPAREMHAADSDELVVIQGIIDAYLEEEDGIVLVDYKTDHVRSPQTLIDHYRSQLDYYARALTQMTGKPVKEKIIYSMALQREIRL